MNTKDIFYFIGRCLAMQTVAEEENIRRVINEQKINWNNFVFQCSSNLVLQTVYVKFRDHGIIPLLPGELAEHIQEIYNLNLKRNTEILSQIDQINQALGSQNIQQVYLKGAGNLIDNLYRDNGERIMSDIDILVKEEDFMKTAGILHEMGYSNSFPVYEDYSGMLHYPALFKPGMPAPIEIHRSPVLRKWSEGLNSEMIFRDMKPVTSKTNCFVPSLFHRAIINFIHSQLSSRSVYSGRVSLRDMYDYHLLTEKAGDIEVPEKFRFRKSLNNYNILVFNLFGGNLNLKENLHSGIYLFHFNRNLSSRIYYRVFKFLFGLYSLVVERYIGSLFLFFFSSAFRKTAIKKISSKEWYKSHFSSLTKRF